MGKVQGVKEKLHFPIYDAFFVKGRPSPEQPRSDTNKPQTFMEAMTDPRMIRFFVDVQNKTRLETNLQASGVLPSLNTFEARAMRVVVSAICSTANQLNRQKLLEMARTYSGSAKDQTAENQFIDLIQTECNRVCSGCSLVLSELIYNSVTTLLVGEKTMIEMPTYFFPSGAGVHSGSSVISNHGEPDPMATFRFAEPVIIEPQQNFRVEMLFPQGVPKALSQVEGVFRIWVVLDGYLTRDVQ
ncbi:hypothetical protein HJG54_24280 [Leptolyngbya sp. NK1-12]|uniref:Uncharacterized protein n=2 Tax=unclassified Leptolyngbya TaxID=2650499 RepID=A0AA96WWZ3_9CYAN|nr:hypothetical protein [Leptolyngbya sp. NK1-12]MBF2046825.1 hypothetical protein [Elainella sp. C42_A2020_010]WNZ25647.1 hypothetical protein HJG54_24280 [Leptolyngbya sp. NK1-12]